MVFGIVADTHGKMHPGVLGALVGVDRILHAGDVGDPAILDLLGSVAPVVAVRGNIDGGILAAMLPENEVVEAAGAMLYLLHDLAELGVDPKAVGFSAVITGHSHVPRIAWKDGVLYLNPGSCGPRRFTLPVTLARLSVSEGALAAEHVTLVSEGAP